VKKPVISTVHTTTPGHEKGPKTAEVAASTAVVTAKLTTAMNRMYCVSVSPSTQRRYLAIGEL
jgi:hypothetical protein